MKAVVFEKHGDPTVLEVRDIVTPQPREGEVLIQVKAIGANRNDFWARKAYQECDFNSLTYPEATPLS